MQRLLELISCFFFQVLKTLPIFSFKTFKIVRFVFVFIVTPIVGVCNCSMFCCTLLYVHSSIAIILMGKRELVALLNLSSWCLAMVERLFLAVPRGCLQFVIGVFLIILTYFLCKISTSSSFPQCLSKNRKNY